MVKSKFHLEGPIDLPGRAIGACGDLCRAEALPGAVLLRAAGRLLTATSGSAGTGNRSVPGLVYRTPIKSRSRGAG